MERGLREERLFRDQIGFQGAGRVAARHPRNLLYHQWENGPALLLPIIDKSIINLFIHSVIPISYFQLQIKIKSISFTEETTIIHA